MTTKPEVRHPKTEWKTEEGCWILEVCNDPSDPVVSLARARVEPGITTQWHRLNGVAERYLILHGHGLARVGDGVASRVGPGDVVVIGAATPQQITNVGSDDLVFYCVCTPRFVPECYETLA